MRAKFFIPSFLFFFTAFTGGLTIHDVEAQQVSPEALADSERIKRLETNLFLNQSLEEGSKLVEAREFDKARSRFEEVLKKAAPDGPNREIHEEAKQRLAAMLAFQAQNASNRGEYGKARSLAREALAYYPKEEKYQKLLDDIRIKNPTVEERFPESMVANQELQDRVNEVERLHRKGDALVNTGQYSRAEATYTEILRIDPYNRSAIAKSKKVDALMRKAAEIRRDAVREGALAEVEKSWNMRPQLDMVREPVIETNQFEESNVDEIFFKLENIRIPELNFTEVDVRDAVNFLQQQSQALDPKGEGVNFVLKAEPTEFNTAEEAPADQPLQTLTLDVRDMPLIKILDFIKSLTNLNYKVEEFAVYIFPATETSDVKVVRSFSVPPTFFTTTITNQPTDGVDEVKIVGADVREELEAKGVTFTSGASAAYLPKTAKLVVRNTLEQISLIEQLVAKESGETTQISIETRFVEFTEDKLEEFSSNFRISADANVPGAFFDAVGNRLPFVPPVGSDGGGLDAEGNIVPADGFPDFATGKSWGKVRAGMGTNLRTGGDIQPSQIDNLLQLGRNRNPAQLGFTGVLHNSGFRYLLSALNSTFGADLISAPKVTLINGQTSTIRVVREFFYPDEYEPPEIRNSNNDDDDNNNNDNNSRFAIPLAIPSTPTDFLSEDIGVTLEVQANATPDRRIDLELKPEVVEFQGFIDYGSPIVVGTTETIRTLTTVAPLLPPVETEEFDSFTNFVADATYLKPVFARRTIDTKMQVVDGQTVVMAGFIRDDEKQIEDKVPFLGDLPLVGRAFRSKVTQSVKSNLAIFITARMVNPDGTPKFLTEYEAQQIGMANDLKR